MICIHISDQLHRTVEFGDIVYYSRDCGAACSLDYFDQDITAEIPASYNTGLQHTFTKDGIDIGEARDYSITAVVVPGV